jgi:hypothetical protein
MQSGRSRRQRKKLLNICPKNLKFGLTWAGVTRPGYPIEFSIFGERIRKLEKLNGNPRVGIKNRLTDFWNRIFNAGFDKENNSQAKKADIHPGEAG